MNIGTKITIKSLTLFIASLGSYLVFKNAFYLYLNLYSKPFNQPMMIVDHPYGESIEKAAFVISVIVLFSSVYLVVKHFKKHTWYLSMIFLLAQIYFLWVMLGALLYLTRSRMG